MKICGVDICVSNKDNYRTTCHNCQHYVDADAIIRYLLDSLEDEHTGLRDIYLENLKNEFGYEKRGILNDGD